MFGRAPTLRWHFLLVAFATVLPLLVFSAALVVWVSASHRSAAEGGLANTARALSLAVDEKIETWKTALASLATSPVLDGGDYATFYRQADAVANRLGGWIMASLPSGQQVVNTLKPFGADLPESQLAGLSPSLLYGGAEHVTDLFDGPVVGRLVIAVNVPVIRNGKVVCALHLGILPEQLEHILAGQELPRGWIAGVLDGSDRVIARAPHLAESVGMPAPSWYTRARRSAPSDFTSGHVRGGPEVMVAYEQLSEAPWTVAVAMPQAELAAATRRPLMLLAGGGAIFLAIMSAALLLLGSRVARPIRALARAARAATQNSPVPDVPQPAIRELNALRTAVTELSHKQVLLREANHRIKNSLQLVSATLELHRAGAADEDVRSLLRDIQAHVQAIARLHERFYTAEEYDEVDAFALACEVCDDIAQISAGQATVQVEAEGTATITPTVARPFALMISELTMNAVKHASSPRRVGRVSVVCRAEAGPEISVVVSDDGPGLPPDFDLAAQQGWGLRMCQALASQTGGSLRIVPSRTGASLELRIPAVAPGAGGATGDHGR